MLIIFNQFIKITPLIMVDFMYCINYIHMKAILPLDPEIIKMIDIDGYSVKKKHQHIISCNHKD
jgi:hypothetical protein